MARGIELSRLETRVSIHYDLDEEDRAYLRRSIRRSAVFNLLTLGHASEPVVEVASSES